MVFDRAEKVRALLVDELNAENSELLTQLPVETYIHLLEQYPKASHYKHISPEIDEFCKKIIRFSSEKTLETYHRLVLAVLIVSAQNHPKLKNLPDEFQQLFQFNFKRIVKKLESRRAKAGYYLYTEDKFDKDLGVCRLNIIPAGAQKVYPCRMSRRFLLKGGLKQFVQGSKMVLLETGGFEPIYKMHTDSRDKDLMKEFNPEGWLNFFKRVAKLLEVNTNIIGLCGSSWFFDPKISEISPELKYLRETTEKIGAHIFKQGTSEGAVRDATFMSPYRIKLHEDGKYIPTSYLMVLPRKTLIKWFEENGK
ncbi:MAG: hypothetical protein GY757_22205 [bacterium]|nr:hypothetical protein [bacterium]